MATRTAVPKEPTTRAGILASGKVRIVATAAELTERCGWWGADNGGGAYFVREKDPAPVTRTNWLHMPPRTTFAGLPGGTPERWQNGHAHYRGVYDTWPDSTWLAPAVPVPCMSPAQIKAELGKQMRRLSRKLPYGQTDEPFIFEETE